MRFVRDLVYELRWNTDPIRRLAAIGIINMMMTSILLCSSLSISSLTLFSIAAPAYSSNLTKLVCPGLNTLSLLSILTFTP